MMVVLAEKIETILEASGRVLAVLPLMLILVQFAIVLVVYVFSSSNIQLQESLQYINAVMFLGGAGYTAVCNGHVRVDVFYGKFEIRNKAKVDFLGTLFLLIPFLVLFWVTSLPYVLDSWKILETSVEASGLPFVYILKSTLLLFALSMSLHAVARLITSFKSMKEA